MIYQALLFHDFIMFVAPHIVGDGQFLGLSRVPQSRFTVAVKTNVRYC